MVRRIFKNHHRDDKEKRLMCKFDYFTEDKTKVSRREAKIGTFS